MENGTQQATGPPGKSGEILNKEFLKPLGMTVNALAMALHVPGNRLYAIVDGARGISPDTALRLGRYFGTGPEFWVTLQAHYDLESTKEDLEEEIERQVQPRHRAARTASQRHSSLR